MIRTYNLKKPLPVGKLLGFAGKIGRDWKQKVNLPEELKDYFLSEAPYFKTLSRPYIVLHSTSECIESHKDGLAKSVFLFPIRYAEDTTFAVGDHEIQFKQNKFYRFNDFIEHRIDNVSKEKLVLVTVSYD